MEQSLPLSSGGGRKEGAWGGTYSPKPQFSVFKTRMVKILKKKKKGYMCMTDSVPWWFRR